MINESRTTTFDNNEQGAQGNAMILKIPGLGEGVKITFPNRRLPVCSKCKGHFKTRDLCRVRKMHTSPPWTPVYICITLDSSCTDDDNKLRKGPFRATNTSWKPYEFKKTARMKSDMPMCFDCKNKNYTGSSCRGELMLIDTCHGVPFMLSFHV